MAERATDVLLAKRRQEESPFWTAFLLSRDVILIHEPMGRIIEANPAAQEKLGYSIDELRELNINDIVLVDEEVIRERTSRLGDEGSLVFEARQLRKDGTTFDAEVRTTAVSLDGRTLTVGIGRDISDHHLAEMLNTVLDRMSSSFGSNVDFDELMNSTVATARRALDSDSAILALKDGTRWSIRYEDGFTKYDPEGLFMGGGSAAAEMLMSTGKPVLANDVRKDSRMNLDFAERLGIHSLLMVPIRVRGSTVGLLGFFCHNRGGAFSDAHVDFANKLAYSVSLQLENAHLSETERAAEAFLRGVVETVPDAITVFNGEGRFIFANREAERTLGLPRDQIMGRSHDDPRWGLHDIYGKPMAPDSTPFALVKKGKHPIRGMEFRSKTRTGENFFSISITPLLDERGEVRGAIASITNISEQKWAEAALQRRTHQLEVLTGVSNELNAQLQKDYIMRALVRAAMELTEANAGTAGTYIDKRMVFTEYNERGKVRPISYSFPLGYGVPGWVMSTKRPYLTNDALNDVHVVPDMRNKLGFTNLIDVPILGPKDEFLGCFEVHNKAGGRGFTNDDLAILNGLASSAAVALANARTLEEKGRVETALRKQKRDYQTVFESVPALIAIKDTQNRVIIANRTFLSTFGFTPDSVSQWAISPEPEVSKRHYDDDLQVIDKRTSKLGIVEKARSGTGEDIWLRTDKMPYTDASGNVVGVIMFSLDITEQKRAQEQLVREKEQVTTLMETTPSGILWVDRDGRIALINRAAEAIIGVEREKMIGMGYDETDWPVTDYDGKPFPFDQLPVPRVISTGQPAFGIRAAVLRPDGRKVMLLMNAAPLLDSKGGLNGIIISLEDVTASILTERALRISLQTSDDIIHEIPSGILLFQYRPPDHLALLSVNPTANILLGGMENKLGLDFDDIWKEGAFFATKDEFLEVARTGQTIWREGVHYSDLSVDGNFTFRAFSLPDDRLCVNFDDVTVRMREAELRRDAFRQIERNIQHFATLVDRIRNPLSAIMAQSEGCGPASGRIIERAADIEAILAQLDQGWLESENVRDFLKKTL